MVNRSESTIILELKKYVYLFIYLFIYLFFYLFIYFFFFFLFIYIFFGSGGGGGGWCCVKPIPQPLTTSLSDRNMASTDIFPFLLKFGNEK